MFCSIQSRVKNLGNVQNNNNDNNNKLINKLILTPL